MQWPRWPRCCSVCKARVCENILTPFPHPPRARRGSGALDLSIRATYRWCGFSGSAASSTSNAACRLVSLHLRSQLLARSIRQWLPEGKHLRRHHLCCSASGQGFCQLNRGLLSAEPLNHHQLGVPAAAFWSNLVFQPCMPPCMQGMVLPHPPMPPTHGMQPPATG